MTALDLHTLVFFIIDKNGGQGDINSIEENNIYNQAQYSYQDFLIGQVQQYQYGRPISKIDYSQNEKIRQKIAAFISDPTTLTVTNGVAPYPNDFILADTMLTSSNGIIKYIAPDRLANFLSSVIDDINDNPVYLILKDGFHFYPTTIVNPQLIYIQKASEIKYATTLDAQGREQYDAANSVDPVWSDTDILEIVVRALAIMGVPLQLNQVQGYAQTIKNQGQ